MSTRPFRSPRRRILWLNQIENRVPGRAAFAIHRGRSGSRARAIRTYALVADLIRQRQALLAAEDSSHSPDRDDQTARHRAEMSTMGDAPPAPEISGSRGQDDPETRPSEDRADGESLHADTSIAENEPSGDQPRPSDDWTKGRLYELAREFDIAGRSKLNKAELLDVVSAQWEKRNKT